MTIRPQAKNANRHTQRGMQALETSIAQDGWIGAITVAADGETFDGSARVEKTAENGMLEDAIFVDSDGSKPIIVRRTDIPTATDPRAVRLGVAANRVASLNLEWETGVLAEIAAADIDLGSLFTDIEWAEVSMPAMPEPGAGGDEFDTTPDDGPTRTRLGELWSIGGVHRLLVGDCTDAANVARLMGNQRAECMWSDPPYGVDYTGKDPKAMKIENDGADDLPGLLKNAFAASDTALQGGAAIYIAHPAGALCVTFGNAFINQGWRFHQTLVWLKNSMVLGHSDYHFKHEPLIFGYKPGEGRYGRGGKGWYGNDSQVSVFEVDRPQASHDHPTEKPIELIKEMLRNSSAVGGLIYDPFLGSGTTLIAAHRTGRRCYGMEIAPRYADVILRRAEAEGLECTLLEA